MSFKKIILSVTLLITAIAAGLWIVGRYNQQAQTVLSDNSTNEILTQLVSLDTDNDGLADWEETLWKTDPTKPDTDLDGTADGAEVDAGRDPTKAGPNDALPKPEVEPQSSETKGERVENFEPAKLTMTDRFSRQFFTSYLAARSQITAGQSAEERGELFRPALDLLEEGLQPKIYSKAELLTALDNSQEKLLAYWIEVGTTLQNHQEALKTNALQALNLYFKKSVAKDTVEEELKVLQADYAAITEAMKKVPVPTAAASDHLKVLNSASTLVTATAGLLTFENDPLLTVQAVPFYYENFILFETNILELVDKLEKLGAFGATELNE